ncbi:hypothetical protein GMORB2_7108 [Geosmithia morbida]|uniref:Uncharacterized protein n=1 Tax=Geosmithia morbida TaxID=1094350 RepID=A0A9P4YW44_9HYPO|nr:uncharacterized protein GMORB2_7108 [Geosmithia morbida]KAF4122801.1 hypothetical protein GMORB2_7108 [Geosmithia morbida]
MAFHQPRRPIQRPVRPPAAEDREPASPQPQQSHLQDQNQLDQSQTSWVLFSPTSVDDHYTESELSGSPSSAVAPPSLKTPGRSRLGDPGSAQGARSDIHDGGDVSISAVTTSAIGDDLGDEDAELDSLDSHLPSFRSLPRRDSSSQQQPGGTQSFPTAVFPSHDGLGSFHLQHPTSGTEAQDQIYRFEKFNPRRTQHRRESLDRIQTEWESEQAREAQRRQRIEAWRLEHSRVLLEEIQRETRRRRRSSMGSAGHVHAVLRTPSVSAKQQPQSSTGEDMDDLTWHDEDADVPSTEPGLLAKFAQTVIKDILGIDDRMLSLLVGEAMPEDADEEKLSTTPRASHMSSAATATNRDEPWQTAVLERVSRELGLLVNQLSHHHPGAFSTYTKVQQMPLPYAGLPVIPETGSAPATTIGDGSQQTPAMPQFQPTIKQATRPTATSSDKPSIATMAGDGDTFTKEEWERDLDIKLVFRYIRSRFTAGSSNNEPSLPPSPSALQAPLAGNGTGSLAASTSQDTAAKAARVRQHHPLISRSRTADHHRRAFRATAPTVGPSSSPVAVMRHHSSCASQSTRRSTRRSSVSSRHYWDIGGSRGTGSVIASNGPMGSWGEV